EGDAYLSEDESEYDAFLATLSKPEESEHNAFLANLSLVCRAWLPASRNRAFRRRRFKLDAKGCRTLRSLMDSPHATLTLYIRHLAIRLQPLDAEKPDIADDMRLLPPFPSVSVLELVGPACVYFGSLSSQALATKFPPLTSLLMTDGIFDTFDDV